MNRERFPSFFNKKTSSKSAPAEPASRFNDKHSSSLTRKVFQFLKAARMIYATIIVRSSLTHSLTVWLGFCGEISVYK